MPLFIARTRAKPLSYQYINRYYFNVLMDNAAELIESDPNKQYVIYEVNVASSSGSNRRLDFVEYDPPYPSVNLFNATLLTYRGMYLDFGADGLKLTPQWGFAFIARDATWVGEVNYTWSVIDYIP